MLIKLNVSIVSSYNIGEQKKHHFANSLNINTNPITQNFQKNELFWEQQITKQGILLTTGQKALRAVKHLKPKNTSVVQ